MIYAVDFDGTLCSSAWPGIGEPNRELISFLLGEQRNGAELILWTMREGEPLQEAIDWCCSHGLVFDAVNDNVESAKRAEERDRVKHSLKQNDNSQNSQNKDGDTRVH